MMRRTRYKNKITSNHPLMYQIDIQHTTLCVFLRTDSVYIAIAFAYTVFSFPFYSPRRLVPAVFCVCVSFFFKHILAHNNTRTKYDVDDDDDDGNSDNTCTHCTLYTHNRNSCQSYIGSSSLHSYIYPFGIGTSTICAFVFVLYVCIR